MADDEIKSRYESLVVPEFKSAIPAILLGKLGEQERYIVDTLSKMEQRNDWLVRVVLENNRAIVELDTRHAKVEIWKERLTSKWTLLVGIGALLLPEILKALWTYVTTVKKP